MLTSLVYLSRATGAVDDEQLLAILSVARSRNESLGVTGMLVHRDGLFMQCLEGPKTAVGDLYQKIAADPRHRDAVVLRQDEIQDRAFPAWRMAFGCMRWVIASQPGVTNLQTQWLDEGDLRGNTDASVQLLRSFLAAGRGGGSSSSRAA